jgi:transcriptional regulator with XRE-family HTH domain
VAVDRELQSLGLEVRRLRKAQGLSQEELGDRCELHANYIGYIERGERDVGVRKIFAVAKGLGVHPARLLEGMQL